ncbi:G-protein coupled receptor GRL101-like [Littorina saxatilis]|uniref:G-protein coupled receptor GRL101-like n=1 Tax=Littorina saxatilis TaxID=31220 RepID=UPI0038B52764
MWNSKVIAYFASVAGMAKLPGCAALPSPQFRYENPLVTMPNFTLRLIDCKTRYKSTYVCEPPPSRLLNPNRPLLKFVPSSENARIKILSPSIAIVPVKATAKSSEAASKFDGHTTQSTIPGATSDLVHSTVFSLHKEALSGHTALSSLLTPISSTDSVVSSGYATISSEGNRKTSSSSRKSPIEVVACPNGHVTHAFLACDVDSACWSASSQEQCVAPVTPLPPMFRCKNGVDSVPYTMLCDSRADCRDSSDEDFCDFPSCTGDKPYSCGSGGQCFNWRQKCDGTYDCVDGSDESCCGVSFLVVRQFRSPPPPGRIEIDYIVNVIALTSTLCPKGHFQCPGNGYCLPIHFICNGIKDCPGMEDETACDSYTCSGLYRCRGSRMCVELREVCDDKYEPRCPQSDDELLCDLSCPANCTCRGLAFFCAGKFPVGDHPSLRFLEARGSGLSLGEVVNNTELVHLGLAACGIRNLSVILLPRIHSVDLSDNHLSVLSLQYFQRLRHLRELILSGNPFTSSTPADAFSPLRGFRPLRSLDLSRTLLNFLHKEVIQVFTDIKVLNVSHSRLSTLQGLEELKSLEELDLRGCKLTDFQAGILQNILNLERLYADNPKMCCPAALPDGFDLKQCFAPTDDISSCDALLRSNIYRVVLAIFAVLALLGNLVSFIFRVRLPPTAKKLGFNVFVTQLCLSDFLMGVYLAMIGVADQLYLGSYVWQDEAWKMSTACKVAGFLSLLSSETSALIVCLITVERFLVLHFPFSRLHFKDRSAYLASSVAWGTGLVLASLPLMPATQHWRFYSQTGICLPLPVTGADFPGHGYSFGVMIVCNLVLCLLIGVGQCFIYWSVKSNTMAPMAFDATRKTSDAAIARRLLTVVMSNFLCWFPIGLCGVMSSNGYPIPGEVNVAMAIFVLPLNSALNPFLYTLNIILERREKRREERLKKFLISEIKSDRLNRQ